MAIKYFVSDNDGVNIDSEDTAMRVMDSWGVAFVGKYAPNADIPEDFIYKTYPGTSTNKIVEALITKYELPLDKIAADLPGAKPTLTDIGNILAEQVTAATNECFKRELTAVPGTTQALSKIREIFGQENMALMTTSPAGRMNISLEYATDPATEENARLAEFFPEGPQRRSGYGHNNKYDEGFAALGWDPAECVIVEDSRSGVQKAKKGRPEVSVIGTASARFFENKDEQARYLLEDGADIVITTMRDLPAAAQWIKDGKPEQKPAFAGNVFFSEAGPSRSVTAKPATAKRHSLG